MWDQVHVKLMFWVDTSSVSPVLDEKYLVISKNILIIFGYIVKLMF